MAKIRYLQQTHNARSGDVRVVDDQCAKVLVLLKKAEYFIENAAAGEEKKELTRSNADVEPVPTKKRKGTAAADKSRRVDVTDS